MRIGLGYRDLSWGKFSIVGETYNQKKSAAIVSRGGGVLKWSTRPLFVAGVDESCHASVLAEVVGTSRGEVTAILVFSVEIRAGRIHLALG